MSSLVTQSDEPAPPPAVLPSATPLADAILDAVANRLASRRLPEATYRLQFTHSFTFRDATEIVPYLAALGITDAYGSPYTKARSGTSHGYDVVDHNALNPEIGDEADCDAYAEALRSHGMGQILDVVPNHMGVASGENAWWLDVLENGPGSPYASFFDIDWMPLKPDLANKVLVPVLGDQYGKVLEDQQLVLTFEEGAFFVRYFDHRFPIAPHSWSMILSHHVDELERRLGADQPHMLEYHSILAAIAHLPPQTETDSEKINVRRREKEVLKRRLIELTASSEEVSRFIAENVALFNGKAGEPQSFDLLDKLLLDQSYRLAYWRVAADEINYRRFFDVNELAAICMENPEVFQKTHRLILGLLEQGRVTGLRIDHPDGLYDPEDYLHHLQRARFSQLCHEEFEKQRALRAAETTAWESIEPELLHRFDELSRAQQAQPLGRSLYLVVEKILEPGERLPDNWPVHGTTGYDFLAALNGLFVDQTQAKAASALYTKFTREPLDFKEHVYRCKKLIMQVSMSSEINMLGHQLDRISERNRRCRDFTLNSITEALREVIACFPVYRTYVRTSEVSERDRHYIERAVARALRKNPATSASVFEFLRDILLLNNLETQDDVARAAQVRFVGRFQQVTGPVMAKSVEDTAFYIYNRLDSLNEVGGDPERFGTTLAAFHQQNIERQAHWPHSLLATSTHDTKRSEDVRTRIDVLSEIPKDFRARVFRWARLNQSKKAIVEDEPAPSRNDEFLLYQTLVGAWPREPLDADQQARSVERIQQYMLKATREAKAKTSWISPNEPYEQATRRFVAAILQRTHRNLFLADFEPFVRQITTIGYWSSLSQILLKLTAPGVADFYQGCELWDYSLVDPDNRRPVDYALRREMLKSMQDRVDADDRALIDLARELVDQPADGRIKLFLIWRMLTYRRACPGLITTGRYIPLDASGRKKEHICAFARKTPQSALLVLAPRLVARLTDMSGAPPTGEEIWSDTELVLPQPLRGSYRNILTGEEWNVAEPTADSAAPARLRVSTILGTFPVAALARIE